MSVAPARPPSVSRADVAGAPMGVLRSVRAAVVGLSASGLGLLGHLAAGGTTPPLGQLVLVVLALLVVSLVLSARRWTVGPLLAVLLGSQVLFHVAFSGAGAVHVHGGQRVAGASAMPGHPWLLMLVGHGVAALLTALLLRRGEDWLWRLVALLARAWRVVRIASDEPVAVGRSRAMPRSGDVPAVLDLLEHAVARRGPPKRVAV